MRVTIETPLIDVIVTNDNNEVVYSYHAEKLKVQLDSNALIVAIGDVLRQAKVTATVVDAPV